MKAEGKKYGLTKAEYTERKRLLELRWLTQEEFDRLKELNIKYGVKKGL